MHHSLLKTLHIYKALFFHHYSITYLFMYLKLYSSGSHFPHLHTSGVLGNIESYIMEMRAMTN